MVPSFGWGWDHTVTLERSQTNILVLLVSRTDLVPKELIVQIFGIGISGELAPDTDDSKRDFGGHFRYGYESRRVVDYRRGGVGFCGKMQG